MGLSSGRVTRQKVCREVHPSISAASKRLTSMPMMPDISRMVVLPNHIRKFISPTSPRVPATEERKRNGSWRHAHGHQRCVHRAVVGKQGEEQHGKGGRHDEIGHVNDGLEERLAPQLQAHVRNQAASISDITICGTKPISHMSIVFPKYLGRSAENRRA